MRAARPLRLVAATGSPTDPELMSGLPHHLWSHGQRARIIDGVITRSVTGRNLSWAAWNVTQRLRRTPPRGYRYSMRNVRRMWLPRPDGPTTVVNCFQLYPSHLLGDRDLRRWFFIDQTLNQRFHHYAPEVRLGRAVARHAIDRELECYERAHGIVVNSEWARRDVVDRYGIEPARVFVVHQSANFDADRYAGWAARRDARRHPGTDDDLLHVVFVGVQWRRKGLDRLLRAVARVHRGRRRVTLDVVGPRVRDLPIDLATTDGVRWHGHLAKPAAEDRLLDLLGAADVGCLLSRAEAGGNCVREFHATGLAVLGTAAGGSAEQMVANAGGVVGVDEDDDMVADRLLTLVADRAEVERAKAVAWRQRWTVQWEHALRRLAALLEAHGS